MTGAQETGELRTIVLTAEDHIRREAQVARGELGPLAAVVSEFIRDQIDLAVRVDLFQPGLAEFTGDRLRGMVRNHDDQPVHLTPRLIDEVLVSPMGRIELADNEAEGHDGIAGFGPRACSSYTPRHRNRPITAMARKTA